MARSKTGLHKNISTIFDGVPLPNANITPAHRQRSQADQFKYAPAQPPIQPPGISLSPPRIHQPKKPTPKIIKPKSHSSLWQQINTRISPAEQDISPTRQKTTLALMVLLLGVFIYVFAPLLKRPETASIAPAKPLHSAAVAESDIKIEWEIPRKYPKTLRDPMNISSKKAADSDFENLNIKGIVYSQDNPSVIIGKQILHKNEEIYGVTILDIKKNSVTFNNKDKTWTQKVGS